MGSMPIFPKWWIHTQQKTHTPPDHALMLHSTAIKSVWFIFVRHWETRPDLMQGCVFWGGLSVACAHIWKDLSRIIRLVWACKVVLDSKSLQTEDQHQHVSMIKVLYSLYTHIITNSRTFPLIGTNVLLLFIGKLMLKNKYLSHIAKEIEKK